MAFPKSFQILYFFCFNSTTLKFIPNKNGEENLEARPLFEEQSFIRTKMKKMPDDNIVSLLLWYFRVAVQVWHFMMEKRRELI